MQIMIVGAGLAGLAGARRLHAAGHGVTLFDKGRGPGGRLSTRRAETPLGTLGFDHGAQYLPATRESFADLLASLEAAGIVARWTGRMVERVPGGLVESVSETPRHVGVPGMNAVVRYLSEGLGVHWGQRITALQGGPGRLHALLETGDTVGPFDQAVVAVPAEQAGDLLRPLAPALAVKADAVASAPNWTLMLAFEQRVSVAFDGCRDRTGAPLAWLARNGSKPGRTDTEAWVAQASTDWSRAHLERSPDEVAKELTAQFCALTGAPVPVHAVAHRWRYAQVTRPVGVPSVHDPEAGLGVCGDWCLGPLAADAWESGEDLARTLLSI